MRRPLRTAVEALTSVGGRLLGYPSNSFFVAATLMIRGSIALSRSQTGQAWLKQFPVPAHAEAAAKLLNSILLLSEKDVAEAIRDQLDRIAKDRDGLRRCVALYAEREFDGAAVFEVREISDSTKRIRKRAVGYSGPPAIRPTRGRARVGSEGAIAYLISQEVERWPRILKNHPGPDRIRAKSSPVGAIVIVTDFIGSGKRVRKMLDKFWRVPSVKSWVSLKWVNFKVVAAAGTRSGIAEVQSHRLTPAVHVGHIAPTIDTWTDQTLADKWRDLIKLYGPEEGRGGVDRAGFDGDSALIAFSSRIPNNTPAMIHKSDGIKWRALYEGPAPSDLRLVFRIREANEIADAAAANLGIDLAQKLSDGEKTTIVVLSALGRGSRRGGEIAIAERLGMSVAEVGDTLQRAKTAGLITADLRLTEKGQAMLRANDAHDRVRPTIATNAEPYYPQQLRIPRVTT